VQAISETRRAIEWQALIDQYPTTFTWDGDTYTGRLVDTRGYEMQPVTGGFISGQTAQLYCLRSSFTDGAPSEGDILRIVDLGWRIAKVELVMGYGIIFTLEEPDKR